MVKKLATGVALALVCLPAIAETNTGFYAGGGAGRVELKDNVAGVHVELTGTGFEVFGGYRFNDYGSLEISYLDAGTPDDTISGVRIESDATAIQASALWQVPINNRFEAFVRFSIVAWDAENTATDGRIIVSQDNDGTDAGFGIGAAFHITPSLGVRAEYDGAEFDGTDFRSLSVAGIFRF
jgi:opacity protein-like surface antigen